MTTWLFLTSRSRRVPAVLALACIVLLAACGDSDATDTAAGASDTAETTEMAETAESTDGIDESADESAADDITSEESAGNLQIEDLRSDEEDDDRSPEQRAIDQFDVTMYQLGVRDLAGVSDCVLERLDSEGLTVLDDEAANFAALFGCEPDVRTVFFGDQSAALGAEQWDCATNEMALWISDLPLTEAQSFFAAPTLPDELLSLITFSCGVSEDEFLTILG